METLDLALLPPLVALLETESVSRAAVRTQISQPAMSRTLKRLRVQLKDELLVQIGRGMRRTTRGDALLEPARAALTQARGVLMPVEPFEPNRATGTVTLALGDDLQAFATVPILRRLRQRAPGLDVRLRPLGAHTVAEARRGEVDIAVLPRLPEGLPDLSDFVLKSLYVRRFVTVSRQRRRLSLDAFCAADHVLVSPQGTDQGFVDDALRPLGRTRRIAVTVQTFGSAVQVVSQSDALLSTLPLDVVRALGPRLHVQRCPVETPRFPMCLCWHARLTHDARSKFLREVIGSAIQDVVA